MFRFKGKKYAFSEGQSVADVLGRAPLGNRSFRLRSWRNEPHPIKETPSAWVTINGVPNLNPFRIKAKEGMSVEPQTFSSPSFIFSRAKTGFYYRHFYSSHLIRRLFYSAIRKGSDYGGPPSSIPAESDIEELHFQPSEHLHPDVLVIGAGAAGAEALSRVQGDVLVVDALPEELVLEKLEAVCSASDMLPEAMKLLEGKRLLSDTRVFYANEKGLFAAVTGYGKISIIEPRTTYICTGAEEIKPVFPGNDLPYVITGQVALRFPSLCAGRDAAVLYIESPVPRYYLGLLARKIRFRTVVMREKQPLPAELGGAEVAMGSVTRAFGARQLETIKAGGRAIACNLLVVCGRRQPRIEIPSLMGLRMRFSKEYSMPVPETDEQNRCREGVFAMGSILSPHAKMSAGSENGGGDTHDAGERGLVCYCLDVTAEDMRYMHSHGYDSLNRMKRFSGLFMGPCQGARCLRNACEQFISISSAPPDMPTVRPPIVPVYIGALAMVEDLDEGD